MVAVLVAGDSKRFSAELQKMDTQKAIYGGTQLSKMRKDEPVTLMMCLTELLEQTFKFFGHEEPYCDDLAEVIISEFWSMKFEEIALVLRNGKAGRYGKIYGKINAQHVIEWVRRYDMEEKPMVCQKENSLYKQARSEAIEMTEVYRKTKEMSEVMRVKNLKKLDEENGWKKFLAKYQEERLGKSKAYEQVKSTDQRHHQAS